MVAEEEGSSHYNLGFCQLSGYAVVHLSHYWLFCHVTRHNRTRFNAFLLQKRYHWLASKRCFGPNCYRVAKEDMLGAPSLLRQYQYVTVVGEPLPPVGSILSSHLDEHV